MYPVQHPPTQHTPEHAHSPQNSLSNTCHQIMHASDASICIITRQLVQAQHTSMQRIMHLYATSQEP